jgi:16S rRNA (guanine527-N7)-methyltransferase
VRRDNSGAAMDAKDGAKERAKDRAEALRLCPSLGAIVPELELYESLLRRWQEKINLVATPTLAQLWTRHFADSAQIHETLPEISRWADLGSGAGFPGLILALQLKSRPGGVVHLIESDQRKAAFLRAVSRETSAPAEVHIGRIETELPKLLGAVEGISARALAPLPQLIDWSREHLLKTAVGAFLKGVEWRAELTEAEAADSFQFRQIESRTHAQARLILAAQRF